MQHDHAAVSERRDGQLDGVHDGERGDVDAAVCLTVFVRRYKTEIEMDDVGVGMGSEA